MLEPSGIKFHRALIRLLRGMLTSWEQWLNDQELATSVALLRKERARLDSPDKSL